MSCSLDVLEDVGLAAVEIEITPETDEDDGDLVGTPVLQVDVHDLAEKGDEIGANVVGVDGLTVLSKEEEDLVQQLVDALLGVYAGPLVVCGEDHGSPSREDAADALFKERLQLDGHCCWWWE